MAAKTSWHRYGTKLRHCHPVYRLCVYVLALLVLGQVFLEQEAGRVGGVLGPLVAARHPRHLLRLQNLIIVGLGFAVDARQMGPTVEWR